MHGQFVAKVRPDAHLAGLQQSQHGIAAHLQGLHRRPCGAAADPEWMILVVTTLQGIRWVSKGVGPGLVVSKCLEGHLTRCSRIQGGCASAAAAAVAAAGKLYVALQWVEEELHWQTRTWL